MSSLGSRQSTLPANTRAYAGAARLGSSSILPQRAGYGVGAYRRAVLGLAKLLCLPLAHAAPLLPRPIRIFRDAQAPKSPSDPNLYVYLGVAVALVLLGGAFAGLTIALMGQDETYLQVIATSGEGREKKHAAKVLNLLNRGKHWVLVTLLLSNVITNETLPIVLDRSLGGGWPAVVSSTVLIVIFGEIAPQSVCVRYGLSIGAFMAPFVYVLMWAMAIVAWPTAKLLDWLLGEDHGTMYKKAGLKTLVQLHKTLGTTPGERLMEDEVTIINSVLDLKEKAVGSIMTPMGDVFTMSADTILDEKMMDTILSQGYSRIPIYVPDHHRNFIGMLLVKILITYDPEDCKRVRDFALATLPETAPYTSCLDIINFFQEGKSHMVLVSDFPGQDKGALGVVTLEDVIEELIGEEIIDESDVFVDVHKAIRRMAPAPRTKYSKGVVTESDVEGKDDYAEDAPLLGKDSDNERKENGGTTAPGSRRPSSLVNGQSATFLMRRRSSAASDSTRDTVKPVPVRNTTTDLRKQLQHLGPSNVASKPRATKFQSVKIKPGVGTIPENQPTTTGTNYLSSRPPPPRSQSADVSTGMAATPIGGGGDEGGEGTGLLKSAGKDAKDGVAALQAGYGTMGSSPPRQLDNAREKPVELRKEDSTGSGSSNNTQVPSTQQMSAGEASKLAEENTTYPPADRPTSMESRNGWLSPESAKKPNKLVVGGSNDDEEDKLGDMDAPSHDRSKPRRTARSGSITETHVDLGGMRKVVLETTSSSSEPDEQNAGTGRSNGQMDGAADGPDGEGEGEAGKKKRKKKRGKKKKGGSSEGGE